ncbi:MAG: radical SAM protein [Lentisphaerota bacterium]
MKVLFINPPWRRFFGASAACPPMGLCHIAAYLKSHRPGLELALYDADLEPAADRYYRQEQFSTKHLDYVARVSNPDDPLWQEVLEFIKKFSPDVIGISVMTATFTSGLAVARLAKIAAPGCKVVMGGKHATALPEHVLKNGNVDYVAVGEGELTFTDLLDNINSPEKVPGIYYRNESGKPVFTGQRKFIENLSELPLPIFLADNAKYDFQDPAKASSCTWELIGARGCPYKCSFCATEHQVRTRSVEHILKEMEYVNRNFGISHFRFQDDSFSFSKQRALNICAALKATGFTWECNTRVDLLDDEIVNLMKTCNCKSVSIGIESASKATLERIHKKIDPDAVSRAVALLKKYEMKIHGYFMIGFPWENYKAMKNTLNFSRKLKLDSCEINFVVPLPGTELFAELVAAGKINTDQLDWTRFQQASYYMNFSDYPDKKWTAMLKAIQKNIDREPKVRQFKHRLRYLWQPRALVKKIYQKIKK